MPNVPVSPAALFASTLNALTSTITNDNDNDNDSSMGDNDSNSNSNDGPQGALLEILSTTIPYISASNPNLYLHQFPSVSRALRGIVTSLPFATDHDGLGGSGGSGSGMSRSTGWNALLRSTIRTASIALHGILVVDNASGSGSGSAVEKEILKLFHGVIVMQFDDSRAKVRRSAHSAALELLHLSASADLDLEGNGKGKMGRILPRHMVEYAGHIISSFMNNNGGGGEDSKKKKKQKKSAGSNFAQREKVVRLLHLLSFLQSCLPLLKEGLTLAKSMLSLLQASLTSSSSSSTVGSTVGQQKENQIMVCNATFSALLPLLDTNSEMDSVGDKDQEEAFCAQAWAVLLQSHVHLSALTSETDGEARLYYTRAIVAIALRLLESSNSSDNDSGSDSEVISALIPKLLPMSFTTLVNNMKHEGATASTASMGAEMTRLIRSPAFKSLMMVNNNDSSGCVDSCIATLGNMMQISHRTQWDICFPILSAMVTSVTHGMVPVSPGTVTEEQLEGMKQRVTPLVMGLVNLHKDVDDKASKRLVESAVGSIIEGVGVEIFLSLVSLGDGNTIAKDKAWIIHTLQAATATSTSPYRPHLAFFQSHILSLARACDASSGSGNGKGKSTATATAVEKSMAQSRVVELWSLFPYFCKSPGDIEVTFPALAQTLVRAMGDKRYSALLPIICSGLTTIAKCTNEQQMNVHGMHADTMDRAGADAKVLSTCSTKILPSLFRLVESLNGVDGNNNKSGKGKDKSQDMDMDDEDDDDDDKPKQNLSQEAQRIVHVTDAIASLAPFTPETFLKGLFQKVIQRLLIATQTNESDSSEKMCTLLGLAQALVQSQCLEESSITLLYRAVKPILQTDAQSARVQKRAYKTFAELCRQYPDFVTADGRLQDIIDLMIGATMVLQVSARYMRLRCISLVVKALDIIDNQSHMDIIPNIMGEVLLSLKDANGKTREAAYQLLLNMSELYIQKNDMTTYFQIIVGGLGAQTTHMRSAAVMALSRVVFEHARTDMSVQNLLPSLLQTVIVLFDEESREVIKSAVGFVRVSIAALNKDQLEPILPDLVEGLMKYNRGKSRFRAKIKIILKKLVRYYGYERITPLVPLDDTRLLNHMRKLADRAARQKAANAIATDGQTLAGGNFDNLMDSDEDDSDDGRTLMTGITGFTKLTSGSRKSLKSLKSASASAMSLSKADAKSVRSMAKSMASGKSMASTRSTGPRIDTSGERSGDILDMLDPKVNKNVRFAEEDDESDFSDDGEAIEFDKSGKLVIGGDDKIHFGGDGNGNGNDKNNDGDNARGGKRMRVSKFQSAVENRDGGNVKRSKQKQENKKRTKELGSAYKSKKAGGDVRKKEQKFEPYAFVPLEGRKYSKKIRAQTVDEMSTVVRQKGGGKRKRR